jgi:uncharacterized damage-inducible protein DinB
MKVINTIPVNFLFLMFFLIPAMATAQIQADSYLNRVEFHLQQASNKLLMLAEVFPEDDYNWSPDGVAMTVAEVLTHIVRYNYSIPSEWLGIDIPETVELSRIDQIQNKAEVINELNKSITHVKGFLHTLTAETLTSPAAIYGSETENWAALFFMITHLNEHTGQLISYARMNGITPPWSN